MALLFELVIDELKDGITAISIVDEPAILTNFMKFASEEVEFKMAFDEDKKIITGPVIIPNVKIFRNGKSLGLDQDAYVYFKEETVRILAETFLAKLRNNDTTIEHAEESKDFTLRESWIIESKEFDKSISLGFDLPIGTWMASYKVHNDDVWKKIKDGELNGFSIEAALGLVAKGEFSFNIDLAEESDDKREVIPDDEVDGALEQLFSKGHSRDLLERFGFILVSEGGRLTKEGEALMLNFAIESDPEALSKYDDGAYAYRYVYNVAPEYGPSKLIDTSRKFCRDLIHKDLVYRKEDIDMMSFRGENPMSKQNYSIFDYKGSYNCRHVWEVQVYFAADYEKALDELELYIEELESRLQISVNLLKRLPKNKAFEEVNEILDETLNDIKKTLEDFKKAPFKDQIKPSNIVPDSQFPGDTPNESLATKVNVRTSREIELAVVDEIRPTLDLIEDAYMQYGGFIGMLNASYERTNEKVFNECAWILEDAKADMLDKLEKVTK